MFRTTLLATALLATACGPAAPTTISQAVNSFENAQATGGMAMTVDVGGPETIAEGVEFAGFAFGTYDVDVAEDSVTMTLVADLANLQITQYDDTTFDRYYFAFDEEITSATIGDSTDAGFAADITILAPGSAVSTDGSFVEGLATDFTFDNGAILVTIGDGTDLETVSGNDGSLTIEF